MSFGTPCHREFLERSRVGTIHKVFSSKVCEMPIVSPTSWLPVQEAHKHSRTAKRLLVHAMVVGCRCLSHEKPERLPLTSSNTANYPRFMAAHVDTVMAADTSKETQQ